MCSQGQTADRLPPRSWPLIPWLAGILLSLATLSAVAHSGHASRPHPFIVSGVVINSDAAAQIEALANMLGKAAGYPLQVQFAKSYSALSDGLRNDPYAIGWTCGAPFVEDHIRDGQQLIGVPLFRGQPTYHSLIITRQGRPEKSLLDFKGQVLAYSDSRSNSGYIVPAYELSLAGFSIEHYFRLLLHAGNHERSIEALMNGLADVAAIDEYVWVEYLKVHPAAATTLHEIARLGPFPFTPIVAGQAVSGERIAQLQQALLSLSSRPAGQQLLQSFGLDGFSKQTADFYLPIEKMLRQLNRPLQKVAP